MKITIDDRVLETDATTLGGALMAAQSVCEGRMVVQAVADGSAVSAADLLNPPETSPYCEELHFQTADPSALVHETLYSAVDIIRGITPRQKEVSDLFLDGEVDKGKDQLMQLLSGWLDVNKTVQLCTSSGHVSREVVDGLEPSFEDSVRKLSSDLNELRNALEGGDFTAVSDLLAYEVKDQAEGGGGILTTPAESLR